MGSSEVDARDESQNAGDYELTAAGKMSSTSTHCVG